MSQTIRTKKGTITVANGVGTTTISGDVFRAISDAGGHLEQVLIKAPKVTDTFNFDIIDSDSFNVFDAEGSGGKINDITQIPLKGDITLSIDEATTDGVYDYKLIFKEEW